MSTTSKAGPCRIPTFTSRIPQISKHAQPEPEISAKHVGKRVRVGEKEGILKYVGNVHFAKGTFCGVELTNSVGKNDGFVNGVRYFTCSALRGLMAPLAKVSLIEGSCESLNDGASGPYSMLFLDPKLRKTTFSKDDKNCTYEIESGDRNETFNARKNNCTYDLESKTNSTGQLDQLVSESPSLNSSWDKDKNRTSDSSGELNATVVNIENNTTFNANKESDCMNDTYRTERELNQNTKESILQRRGTYDVLDITETINITVCSSNKKRTNETFSEPTFDADKKNTTITKSDNLTFEARTTDNNLTYLPINKSCEDLLNESSVEVKRRRTSNPKNHKADAFLLQNLLHTTLNKPSSLPQLRSLYNNDPAENSQVSLVRRQLSHSTPVRSEFSDDLMIKLRVSDVVFLDKDKLDDENSNKRDSLDCEESLGILTPDQMTDFTQSRSPSLEYAPNRFSAKFADLTNPKSDPICSRTIEPVVNTELLLDTGKLTDVTKDDLQSPNLASITDYSLGLIDDQILSHFTLRTDTTMNLELPLDSVGGQAKEYTLTRCEQTPSPEELPLDTTPIVESEPKTEPTKSKTTSSFITSITSITSLDTGYQGDGEMSRPASRGADNSPLTRRPLPRPQTRRPDPMTDSDFYTESDADNHEENQLRGDRRAQVIDGTLYGVDPQAAADIYVNNRENMDSSGIFTDIESNTRNDDDTSNPTEENLDVSPSDTSTKTLSENSQNNLQEILVKSLSNNEKNKELESSPQSKENSKKRNAPSPGISSPSSLSSPRHTKEENSAKKYKMPKRDVASKVKAMIEPVQVAKTEKKILKKPAGRWDAVMDKISKSEQNKTNLKDIKSKVFNSCVNVNSVQKANEVRKPNTRSTGSPNAKTRRVRTRTALNATPLKKITGGVAESVHSSLSDLSAAGSPPKNPGSAKKRDAIQVTQVLTANKLSPRGHLQSNLAENNKKNASTLPPPPSSSDPKAKRNLFSAKEKKQPSIKECGKTTVKGGRTSPSVRPPPTHNPRAPVKQQQVPRVAEALAVLVQHLVFNVEAYQVPTLRRQCEKYRLEAEEVRLACQHLEETLANERLKQTSAIEDERIRFRKDITDLIEQHRNQIAQITARHGEFEQQLKADKESAHQYLSQQHDDQLNTLRREFEKLQRTHEESLDILREENESIREQIDEKRLEAEKATHESLKLKKDYESKEIKLKEKIDVLSACNEKLQQQSRNIERDFDLKFQSLMEENRKLREENDRLLSYGDDKGIGIQEVQSLRVVLELKQTEVADLRRNLAEAKQKLESLVSAEEKAAALLARCEDLQLQLQRKSEYEQSLLQENQKLQESFKDESNQKRILSQYNEELQYKLKQNKEVINKVMEQAEESIFNRSIISSSFNERHSSTRNNLERTLSFRERSYSNKSSVSLEGSTPNKSRKSKNSLDFEMDDVSPPSSPKVKGVVEKSDSVSYVLDLDESPDVVASRIVRRSFRNSTPPKSTPTKSPANKRARIRNPLSLSSSSSSILTATKNDNDRPRSASARNDNSDSVFIWNSSPKSYDSDCRTSPKSYDGEYRASPKSFEEMLDESCESGNSSMKLEDNLDLDEDNDVDLQLPALPSELDRRNGAQAVLPSPKHLAGEAMISESNSEDESTSSSQL